jgi:hypothetical protein
MSDALRYHLQRRYSKLLVLGTLVHIIWAVGFGGASCILREQKSELGSKERRRCNGFTTTLQVICGAA